MNSRRYKYPLIAKTSKAEQKMSLAPKIFPRSHDRDVWAMPHTRHSAVNHNNMRTDITEEYTPLAQPVDHQLYDTRLQTFGNISLDQFETCIHPTQLADMPPAPTEEEEDAAAGGTTAVADLNIAEPAPTQETGGGDQSSSGQQTPPPPTTEGFFKRKHTARLTSLMEENFRSTQPPSQTSGTVGGTVGGGVMASPVELRADSSRGVSLIRASNEPSPAARDDRRVVSADDYKVSLLVKEPLDRPPQGMLIPRTIQSVYGPGQVTRKERTKYLSNIQPNIHSFSDVAEPINANMGISYTPALPPLVLDQVATPHGVQPLFHRIDPQLVRDQGLSPERLQELPKRGAWSAKYSNVEAAPGTVNFEDIYDPRFNSYGDPYRSYVDVNLGQVQYYYSDVDAYRDPNFSNRSKVDFIEFTDPMGRVLPEYQRHVGFQDIKDSVHNQFMADTLYQREDLMERLMRKRNQELWQLRAAPVRNTANAASM